MSEDARRGLPDRIRALAAAALDRLGGSRRPSGRRLNSGGMSGCGSAERPLERLWRRIPGAIWRGRVPPRRRATAVRSRRGVSCLGRRSAVPQDVRDWDRRPRCLLRAGRSSGLAGRAGVGRADPDNNEVRLRDRTVVARTVDPNRDHDVARLRLRSLARRGGILPGRGLLSSVRPASAGLRGRAVVRRPDGHNSDVRLRDRPVRAGAVDADGHDHVDRGRLRSHAVCDRLLPRRGRLAGSEVIGKSSSGGRERVQGAQRGHETEATSHIGHIHVRNRFSLRNPRYHNSTRISIDSFAF